MGRMLGHLDVLPFFALLKASCDSSFCADALRLQEGLRGATPTTTMTKDDEDEDYIGFSHGFIRPWLCYWTVAGACPTSRKGEGESRARRGKSVKATPHRRSAGRDFPDT